MNEISSSDALKVRPDLTVDSVARLSPPVPSLSQRRPLSVRIVGLGGAGGNALAHMAGGDLRELRLVALHTSSRILDMTQAPERILLGKELTHGLGAGGDPSLARAAAELDIPLLRGLCQDLDLLFLVTGLGGGTGTGVGPVLARVAKESGALVIAVVTLPFELEGPRRCRQAEQGLEDLKAAADAVICLPNQKIFQMVDEKTSVLESLKMTNELLAKGIRGIWQMLTRPSLLHVDFADLRALLRDRHVEGAFASVEAQGEGRAREVIEQLLASPLLEGGQVLADADAVIVNLIGGSDLSMADVKRVMDEINRRLDNAQLVMGASIVEGFEGRLGLTLVTSRREPASGPIEVAVRVDTDAPLPAAGDLAETPSRVLAMTQADYANARFLPPPAPISLVAALHPQALTFHGSGERGTPASRRLQQGDLPLQIVSKGRFEKSHPTIHRGEDLDVPTYVRRGVPLN